MSFSRLIRGKAVVASLNAFSSYLATPSSNPAPSSGKAFPPLAAGISEECQVPLCSSTCDPQQRRSRESYRRCPSLIFPQLTAPQSLKHTRTSSRAPSSTPTRHASRDAAATVTLNPMGGPTQGRPAPASHTNGGGAQLPRGLLIGPRGLPLSGLPRPPCSLSSGAGGPEYPRESLRAAAAAARLCSCAICQELSRRGGGCRGRGGGVAAS